MNLGKNTQEKPKSKYKSGGKKPKFKITYSLKLINNIK